jgi:hypothetical protein
MQEITRDSAPKVRELAGKELQQFGGLGSLSKTLSQQMQMPNLKLFGSEKDDDVERREDWLEGKEFKPSRAEMKRKLQLLVAQLQKEGDAAQAAQQQVQKIEKVKNDNLTKILKKNRQLEQSWRELDLFFGNAAQRELKNLVILNANTKDVDEAVITAKVGAMLEEVNSAAIDQSKNYSFLVAPGFQGQTLIEKFAAMAHSNKVLFLTDYENKTSAEDVMEAATEEGKPRLGGVEKVWSRTVMYTNYALLRDKYAQERGMLYGSPAAAVAGKMYSIDNIAQPIAGAQFGPLRGLKGIRFRVSQDQANTLDSENFNPLTEAFGSLMPFNCVTMFKGENVELRQYSVIRTLDYIDKLLKHFLNQYVFTSMQDSAKRGHVHKSILGMLEKLEELKILKRGRITHFDINEDRPDRFDIRLDLVPMYVTSAFEYTIGIDPNGVSEDEKND